MLQRFQYLLSFGVMEPIYPLIIKGEIQQNKSYKNDMNNIVVDIVDSDFFYNTNYKLHYISPAKMLFRFNNMRNNYQILFKNWFKKAEPLKLCLDLFFSIFYNQRIYIEQEFLNLYQSLEFYLGYKNCKNPKKPNMNRGIKQLIDQNYLILGNIIENNDDLVNKIIRTRQYLVHPENKTDTKAIKGGDLLPVIEKIRILFIACLLIELGFSQEDAKIIFSKSVKIKRLSELMLIKWD